MKVLVGIPAFNEEEHIGEVVGKSRKYGKVYVVNDGSTDSTFKQARGAFFVYSFKHNRGYGSAIKHLFKEAKENDVDVLVTLDGDGQHDPQEIPHFLQAIKDGADVVIGNRFMGKTDIPSYREAGVKFVSSLIDVGDAQCGFRAYNKGAINSIKITEKGMGASLEILRRAKDLGLKIKEIPVTITYDDTTHSQNPLSHGFNLIETLFWGTIWKKPLWVLGLPSFISLSLGLFFTLWLLLEYSQTGWFPVSLAFLSLGGLLVGVLLGISTLFVLIGKRLLEELK